MQRLILRALPLLAVAAVLAPHATAQVPFPIDKNARLDELGNAFTVTGRQRLPRRVSIEALRAMTIRGEGEDATLEVEGDIKMRAATGGQIEFINVWLELTPACKEITLAQCIFKGKGGIRPSLDGPSRADVNFAGVECDRSASITIEGADGHLLLDRCYFDGPLALRGVDRSATTESSLTLALYGSSGKVQGVPRGLLGGVTIEGLRDGTIRGCDMDGKQALFLDNRKLFLDGNNLRADRVEFRNTENGKFGGLKISKTDFRAKELVLVSPLGKAERLTMEKCYFKGIEDPDTIRSEMLQDAVNSESGVTAVMRDVSERPNGLAGEEQ